MNSLKLPTHVAIMMDGNGRWAKEKGLQRHAGHVKGCRTLETITKDVYELGIKYLTVFAFSTENWKRPIKEVNGLMILLRQYLKNSLKTAKAKNMRVRILGNVTKLDNEIQQNIIELEKQTKNNTGFNLQIAINYGGKDDIVRAMTEIAIDIENKKLKSSDINEQLISSYLDTSDIPDPDLFIRTSGEERISNFLLWQLSYSEFYFSEVLWPDFSKEELILAIEKYGSRERRFGEVSEE